jgi:virulence factor Mce-like protein
METRSPGWGRLVGPTAFFVLCVVVSILTWRAFGGSTPLQPEGYRLAIPLRDATNIYKGSDVVISGVKIGDVVKVRRTHSGALVTADIKPRYAPLRSDALATTRTKTLLGEGYIEIAPGSRGARPVPDGGRLAATQIRPAQQLDQVLKTFAPGTRRDIRSLFAGVSKALAGREQDLNDAVGESGPAFTNLAGVAETIDRQRDGVQRLIANAGDVFQAMGERSGLLQAAVTQGERLFAATASRDRALTSTVQELPGFLAQLRGTSRVLGGAGGDLDRAVVAAAPVASSLAPGLRAIDNGVPEFRALFRRLPGVIAAGRRGLPAATRIVRAAGKSLPDVYPATRELLPFLQLLAVDRDQMVAYFTNVAQLSGIPFIGPGNKVLRGIGGIPSLWNETLAGWVKKLPTNRQNAYPKPRSALQIAEGGLRAFDCRNVNNKLYVPPLGTGSPPCVEQGPWTFNGKTARFPRLTLAAP